MIRGSAVIAAVAVLVSLLLHAWGLTMTASGLDQRSVQQSPTDAVELGNRFEDLAETVTEPVTPEPAPTPEPPVEEQPPPAPEPAEIPTSEVHVASDDPQKTFSPDTGTAEVLRPVEPEPVRPEDTGTAEAEDGEDAAADDVEETPSAETADAVETPQGDPETVEPVVEAAPTASAPQQLAALPEPAETPETLIAPVEAEPVPETTEDGADSELAVVTSIRPRLPDRRAPAEPQGVLSGSRDFSDLRFPTREIESPLTTYRRRGIDTFTVSNSGSGAGGRGPGNSDRTNYAGQVLVHLNRAPIVYTAARGFAKVFFEISPDGTLAWVDVVDSTGTPDVERAAKAQVRAASPFPPPPGGVSRKLSFVYSSN